MRVVVGGGSPGWRVGPQLSEGAVRRGCQQRPEPLRSEQTIQSINPGDTRTVTFRDFGLPQFGARTNVKVDVEPVPGETNTNNNTADYVVFFTIPD